MKVLNKFLYSYILGLLTIITLTATGCHQGNSSVNEDFRGLLAEYMGQRLVLPSDSLCSLLDRSYGLDFIDADFLIVSYIDTDGCTPCHLHLPYWKALNERLDTLSTVYATSVLIIRPDTLDKVIDFISQANYDYPVIIDTLGRFTEMNRMPDIPTLHTYLVDNNHIIRGLGNPTVNNAIDRIYMQIITGRDDNAEEKSPLKLDNNVVDIGTVPPGAEREFEFIVKNLSNDTIQVSSIMTPCDCIEATATDIMPAANGTIRISFHPLSSTGVFHHPIVVRYDNISQPIIIHLYGMVSQ